MNITKISVVVIAAALLIGAGLGLSDYHEKRFDREARACIAGQNEACPNSATLRLAEKVKDMQDELSTPAMQEKIATLSGYQNMLAHSSPGPQYDYNFDKHKFIARYTPAATPPPSAPPPSPAGLTPPVPGTNTPAPK